MPIFFKVLVGILGLAFVVVIVYALYFISEEFEETRLWPFGRFFKALFGGIVWTVLGAVLATGLFGVAIVVRAIFFRPVFSFYTLQFWSVRVGIGLIAFYLLWGIYHGARNRLSLSYKFRKGQIELIS